MRRQVIRRAGRRRTIKSMSIRRWVEQGSWYIHKNHTDGSMDRTID